MGFQVSRYHGIIWDIMRLYGTTDAFFNVQTQFFCQDEEERPRPEFAAKAPYLEKNPITGVREPAFPKAVRSDYFLYILVSQLQKSNFQFLRFEQDHSTQIAENCSGKWTHHADGENSSSIKIIEIIMLMLSPTERLRIIRLIFI